MPNTNAPQGEDAYNGEERRKQFDTKELRLSAHVDAYYDAAKTHHEQNPALPPLTPEQFFQREGEPGYNSHPINKEIGTRAKVAAAIKRKEATVEQTNEETPEIPQQFKTQYENLPSGIKGRCTWEELSDRLLVQEAHYLKLAKGMEEGGELVYIDEEGNPVFRDGGVEPVLKGTSYNKTREILYGKDYKEGTPHYGYEMSNSNDELRKIEEITGRPFVASKNRDEHRATHMESGENPSFSRFASFYPNSGYVRLDDVSYPDLVDPKLGVVRLLRVKEMS